MNQDLLAKARAKAAAAREAAAAKSQAVAKPAPVVAPKVETPEPETVAAKPTSNSTDARREELRKRMLAAALTQPATPKPEATKTVTSSLSQRVANLKASQSVMAAKKLQEERAQQEAKQLKAAAVEVPAEIIALDANVDEVVATEFTTLMAELYQRMEADQPDISALLEKINKNMRQYEELPYLLNRQQIRLIMDGTMKVTNTVIKTKAAKPTTAKILQDLEKIGGFDVSQL